MCDNSGRRPGRKSSRPIHSCHCFRRLLPERRSTSLAAKVTSTPAAFVFVTENINATSLPAGLLYVVKNDVPSRRRQRRHKCIFSPERAGHKSVCLLNAHNMRKVIKPNGQTARAKVTSDIWFLWRRWNVLRLSAGSVLKCQWPERCLLQNKLNVKHLQESLSHS